MTYDRRHGDRRRAQAATPPTRPERRGDERRDPANTPTLTPQRRRPPSDVPKPPCPNPACTSSTSGVCRSSVYRSRQRLALDQDDGFYRRQRRCFECGLIFETIEMTDLKAYRRKLASQGRVVPMP